MSSQPILAPSILAADFTKFGEHIKASVSGGAQWIHCDIMDGHFVPNISYGPLVVEAANRATDAFLDVHLMIYNPDQYVDAFVKAGADLVSVHVEATPHLHRSIQNIRSKGIKAGVAINPGTPLSALDAILPEVDLVVLMSVNPGFGGQSFIPASLERTRELARIRTERALPFLIELDGGVGLSNVAELSQAGCDVFVAGSSVFGADDIPGRCKALLQLATDARKHFV